jgi:predicted transcriptional regulator
MTASTTTLRVSEQTHRRVAELARATGRQMQAIVEEAVSRYERALFWELFESGYERLAEDEASWSEVQRERRGEAPALGDGVG